MDHSKLKVTELVSQGRTKEALDLMIRECEVSNKKGSLNNLYLLESNFSKTHREYLLGLVSTEEKRIVEAKTNKYLIQIIDDPKSSISINEIRPKLKSFVKPLLFIFAFGLLLYSTLYFYLRRDILFNLFVYGDLNLHIYRLLMPILLTFGGLYLLKITWKL